MIALAPQTTHLQQQDPSERDSTPSAGGPSPFPMVPETLDLRRSIHREHAELLVARASALPPEERGIVETVYDEGLTVARLARLRGECPRALRRRLRRIIARVLSPKFAFVMTQRDSWPAVRRKVATRVVLHGQSRRSCASAMSLSLHTVRNEMQKVDAYFEMLTR